MLSNGRSLFQDLQKFRSIQPRPATVGDHQWLTVPSSPTSASSATEMPGDDFEVPIDAGPCYGEAIDGQTSLDATLRPQDQSLEHSPSSSQYPNLLTHTINADKLDVETHMGQPLDPRTPRPLAGACSSFTPQTTQNPDAGAVNSNAMGGRALIRVASLQGVPSARSGTPLQGRQLCRVPSAVQSLALAKETLRNGTVVQSQPGREALSPVRTPAFLHSHGRREAQSPVRTPSAPAAWCGAVARGKSLEQIKQPERFESKPRQNRTVDQQQLQAQGQSQPQPQQQKQQHQAQTEEGPRHVNEGHRNVSAQQYLVSPCVPVLQKTTAPVSARASWPNNRKSLAGAVMVPGRSPRAGEPDNKPAVPLVTPRPKGLPHKASSPQWVRQA